MIPSSEKLTAHNKSLFASIETDLREFKLKKAYKMIIGEKSGTLLDIGCREGSFSALFLSHGWKVYGVDIIESHLDEALKRGLIIKAYDISKGLPFDDNFFDCIFAGEIVEHLIDTDFFIQEMFRVTKKNGCVIITTPNLISFENRLRMLFGRYPIWVDYRLEGSWGHVRAYTPKVLKKQLTEHGFIIEKHVGNWVPFIPQRFTDDIKWPWLSLSGDWFPNLSMDIIMKARKP